MSIMLFGNKLDSEIYPPWRQYYMNYTHLKKLLKEGVILQNNWSDTDEQNFVSALDADLEKVYTFQANKYEELSEILDKLQAETENPSHEFEVDKFTNRLEEALTGAQELDHFQRLNYTGFIKVVKKHDRIHPEFSVKPLLNVRLKNLPFHSEDYSPLLYKVSALFQFLRDNYNVNETLTKLSSFTDDNQQEFQSFKFWVHPDNLMEVKTTILRHLPVLVYGNTAASVDDMLMGDDDDDEDGNNDPTINCLYFDNPNFDLYNNKLVKNNNSSSLRFKWIGKLSDKPKISIEKKVFDPSSQDYNVNEKLTLKEKYLDSLMSGNFTADKLVNKMIKKGEESEEITKFADDVSKLSSFIKENNLQPCLRTVYKRIAFQIPGEDRIRIVIDSDLMFIREDSFDQERPIRDPSKWHRTDIDSKVSNPYSLLRKGEFSKFPYSVMEIKVKAAKNRKRLVWIDDLVNSHLVKEIPNFSKFIQGTASLFLEDDKLANIPLWYNELENDIKVDPEQAYIDARRKSLKQQNDEENLSKFKTMLSNSSGPYSPRSKSFSGSIINANIEPLSPSRQSKSHLEAQAEEQQNDDDLGQSSDDYEDSPSKYSKLKLPSTLNIAKLIDVDSEDEEIELPAGVIKPESYIKNAGPLKIEPKVWLANERTFNRWLHMTTLLSTLTFIIYSSANKSNSFQLSEILAYIYFALTLFSGAWGYYIFMRRHDIIVQRSGKHLDNVIGPLVVGLGLTAGLIVNFVLGFKRIASQEDFNDFQLAGVNETFYENNPVHRFIHEFVFKLVGA
mmetsp:Transcript_4759/g.5775  ORF Transcript_4759/g.5775 Transcript_4759/m.5775 type:complete len:786 (+) Transcript_4759:77-2434(+)